jgi:ATP-binding protein involved in chromosome partitioning
MSIGFLLEEGQAVMWRGPMVAGTVKQLLQDVDWGELDYLLVDLPPGTGDAPMSLAQLVPLTGVVIVTTPHSVAANIAGKSAALFKRMNAPLLGVIENMAVFVCPDNGKEYRIFAGMPGEELAKELKIPFLGSVPLDPCVGQASENGAPSVISNPDTVQARAFEGIAKLMAAQSSVMAMARSDVHRIGEEKRPTFEPVR